MDAISPRASRNLCVLKLQLHDLILNLPLLIRFNFYEAVIRHTTPQLLQESRVNETIGLTSQDHSSAKAVEAPATQVLPHFLSG